MSDPTNIPEFGIKREDEKEGVLRELTEESGLYDFLYVEK